MNSSVDTDTTVTHYRHVSDGSLVCLIKRLGLFHQSADKLGGTVWAFIHDDVGDAHIVHPYFLLNMAGSVHACSALSAGLCSEREFAHTSPTIKMKRKKQLLHPRREYFTLSRIVADPPTDDVAVDHIVGV